MENILNITNGDSAVETMQRANIPGVFLPWRDVLHEGPVPEGLSLEELSRVRAQYIASQGWGEAEQIKKGFAERDKNLESCAQYERVVLWFEHDLYDQLQLLQILDWFQVHKPDNPLSMVCTENYLGMLSPAEMQGLVQYQEPVTQAQLSIASKAWAAFRSNTPEKWSALQREDTCALPFLEGAIFRMLEEYPSTYNGLSRTANQALQIIAGGEQRFGKIFIQNQALEKRVFMGDASFWVILQALLDSTPPLLEYSKNEKLTWLALKDSKLFITPAGKEVLAGRSHWLEISNPDYWIGGVHLTQENLWCWDSGSNTIYPDRCN